MSEQAPEAPTQDAPPEATNEPNADAKVDETDWQAEAKKWEKRSKENFAKAKEFDEQRKAAMTDAERSVAEAEERGRTSAVQEFGKRLATSEIRAAAAAGGADLAGVFDYLDISRFVGNDGEPDSKAIATFVAGLPKSEAAPPSFDGGSRTPAPAPQGMSSLIRKAAGRA